MKQQKQKTLFRHLFETKDGKIVIGQFPNIPIILWAVFAALSFLFSSTFLAGPFVTLSSWGLVVWAYLEARSGVNRFRKMLGVTVLLYLTARVLIGGVF